MKPRPVAPSFRSALLLVVVLALCPLSSGAAPAWYRLTEEWQWGRIDGLHFVNPTTGWIAAGGGYIQHTTNGGATWSQQYQDRNLYFRSLMFANDVRGWAGTLNTPNILFETSNGGALWTPVTNIPDPKPNAICGLWVASPLVIYGVGSYAGPARLIKSIDAGATWTSSDLAPLATTLVDVFFFNELEGFVVGGRGQFPSDIRAVVLHTTDGGATWNERYVGSRVYEWGWKISFPDPDTGYVSLERVATPTFVLKTVDGGMSWAELPFHPYNEQGIGFATTRIGWVGGNENPTFGTVDGGLTWTVTPWGEAVDRFQFLTPKLGYASGAAVYKYSEQTLAADPGPTPRSSLVATPNPFTPRTTIHYTLAQSAEVELFVADPTGRVVRTLARARQPAGPHRIEWDGRGDDGRELPSGIYLYVLHAGNQHEMGKLIRVR
jgi:photosystem II stability/assembly factor-like uncharacterized protein